MRATAAHLSQIARLLADRLQTLESPKTLVWLAVWLLAVATLAAPAKADLINEASAQTVGLTRVWYTQAALDPSRHTLAGAELRGDTLYLLTSASTLQAFDAETGRSLWVERLGNPSLPTYGPSVFEGSVAVINGSTLFVLTPSDTGRTIYRRPLPNAPAAGPALASKQCFVPLVNGMMLAYPLSESKRVAWKHASGDRIFDTPSVVGEQVVWATASGDLFGARADASGLDYRFRGSGRLLTPVAHDEEHLFVASDSGYLYSISLRNGSRNWRAALGVSVSHRPVVVGDIVYLETDDATLHAFKAVTGEEIWSIPGAGEFVSQSAGRVYCSSLGGELTSIIAETGELDYRWRAGESIYPLANDQNDRIYFLDDSGLVQCLHEVGQAEPLAHNAPAEPEAEEKPAVAANEANDPFAVEAEPAAEPEEDPFAEDPFAEPDEPTEPAESEADEDDPFGSFDF